MTKKKGNTEWWLENIWSVENLLKSHKHKSYV